MSITLRSLLPTPINKLLSEVSFTRAAEKYLPASEVHPLFRQKHINALPTEVISRIFLLLVKDEFDEVHVQLDQGGMAKYTEYTLYPWTLLEVCRLWKGVCLSNPVLWTYISLNGHHCVQDKYDIGPLLRLCLQLKRSRDALFSFDMIGMCTCRCEQTRLRAVLAHAHRWKAVALCFGCWSSLDDDNGASSDTSVGPDCIRAIVPPELGFSALKELRWHGDPDCYTDISLPLNCDTLSSLQSALFTSIKNHRTAPSFPWAQLRNLVFDNYLGDIHDLIDILNKCESLAHCELQAPWPQSDLVEAVDANVEAHLPRLASLVLMDYPFPHLPSILPNIHIPKLQTLDINWKYITRQDPLISPLRNFLPQFRTSLTKLSFYYPSWSSSDAEAFFLAVLPPLQCLQRLRLYLNSPECDVTCDASLNVIARRRIDPGTGEAVDVLPHLEHLELHNIEFDPMLLAQMVETRTREGHSLSHTYEHMDEEASPRTMATFRSLSIVWHCNGGDASSAKYHTRAASELLDEYVQDRKLKLECSIIY